MFNLLQAQLPSIFPPFPIMMQQGEIGTMSLQQQQQQMYHYGQFLHQCMIQTHAQQMAAFYQKMSETLASNESLPSSRRTTTDNSLHNSTAGTPKLEKDKDSDEFLKFNPDLFNSLFNYKIDTDDC
ncbi:hypothetical protein GCK72_015385 [Caenorhabditis remanei]|uniref:Uncharacterized protein n=1 Tax=Caenorhabditis remanei TaxID=31234 RepID=A0A6A5GWP9_CAERE|nr:hypothetical protein GCK72_015385 [Caenorhabditis remanei]KAF1758925.1 hypothetical protein GCK72_015385 [Caenorhabditis remanei]